jgi:hypothetical protein
MPRPANLYVPNFLLPTLSVSCFFPTILNKARKKKVKSVFFLFSNLITGCN